MKRKLWILILLLLLGIFPAIAQNTLFKPFTTFRTIKTEHFEIIFPEESERSARLLASYADQVYSEISSLLGIEVRGRIPVTFSPHTDIFNGYYHPLFNFIMLYDTPADVEWTTFADNLKSLFTHELTHAISLNSRSPYYSFMHRIFGGLFTPTGWNTTNFMTEGVTVSFESLDGTGRANDPRIKQYLRQAVHEGKFLAPYQASGVYDRPNLPQAYYYEYGGLFSAWLQQTYGMEKYGALWRQMGRDFYFSFFVYRSDFYRIFKKIYGVNFLDAWSAFGNSLAVNGLEENDDELLPKRYSYFYESEQLLTGLAAEDNSLYFIDRSRRKIGIYNTQTEEIRYINSSYSTNDIDVKTESSVTTLLLSGYNNFEDRGFAAVTEIRSNSGLKTGRVIYGLHKARYFREGVAGIRSDLHNTNVVYEDFDGKSEILLRGNESLMFSGPQPIDGERIAVIASRSGMRELWLYNYVSKELFKIESSEGGNEYWRYMRGLRVSEGKLFFAHNANDRMYKLGVVDLREMQAVFNDRDFSGGVFSPVSADNSVYYLGAFASRNSLLRFPERADSLSGERTDLQLVKLDSQSYEIAEDIDMQTASWNEGGQTEPFAGASKPYIGLKYMNPFKFWIPLPFLRVSANEEDPLVSLDGGGLLSIITDPTDRNMITVLAFADIPYKMINVEQFAWTNSTLGFPIQFNFTDKVIESQNRLLRSTNTSFYNIFNWSMGQWSNMFYAGLGHVRYAHHEDGKSAYVWKEAMSRFYTQTGLSLTCRNLNFQFTGLNMAGDINPRIDGIFQARTNTRFPLFFTLFGAYEDAGMDLHGVSNVFGTTAIADFALTEYSYPKGLNLNWIAGGSAGVGLFSVEIQRHLSHLYFNRIYGVLSVRNQIYDSKEFKNAEGVRLNNLH